VTRTEQKQRYNEANYKQVKVSVRPTIANAFKSACEDRKQTQAKVLTNAMIEYVSADLALDKQTKTADPYSTRPKRRKAVAIILDQLERIRDAEQTYLDNMPENLSESERAESARENVAVLDEAIDQLGTAF
jgi:hypothetical protein